MTTAVEPRPSTTRLGARTMPSRVRERAERTPHQVAMLEKRLGVWQEITWGDYWEQVELVAHGLMAIGVKPGDRVAVHSENRPEWLFADVGIVAARAITVGLYPTNPAAEVEHVLKDSGASVLIAEDQEQVDKALVVRGALPELRTIVYLDAAGLRSYDASGLLWWPELLRRGREHRAAHPRLLEELADQVADGDVVTLIYTSGTTGPPKGAMLTVGNVNFSTHVLVSSGGFYENPTPDDLTLSYLPLAHVADRIATEWTNAEAGTRVHFAESIDTVQQNLREVQPTLFFAVPRIWEKIRATVEIRMASASRLKRLNYRLWMRVARRIGAELAERGGSHSWRTRLLSALGWPFLYRPLRRQIGLARCRHASSGAAPIAPETLQWFFGIGVVIYEIYGMTENAAVATTNRPGRLRLGTVGESQPDIDLRLDEATGEILTRHPGVFAGYWKQPEKTAELLDPDGWLHTGDVGEWIDGTHVRIVDRIKDLIITAGGKNVPPSEIENSLKFSPFVKEAIVIGDRRPYLTALVGIELDTVGDWAQRQRIPYTTYRDLSEKREVLRLIQSVIIETSERFSRPERVRKFRVIPKELDHEDGELTATQKVKRAAIAGRFEHLVEDMYGNRTDYAGGDLSTVHTPADAT